MAHNPVPNSEIIETLVHIRDLFRKIRPVNERELRALERREVATKNLLSNLPRTGEHPTLRTLLEIAEIYSLTLDGAHRLFGYSLDQIYKYDLHLNGGRTHIIEGYPFERDLLIDLPARLAPAESFAMDAFVRDLVVEWQTGIPIRVLDEEGWEQPGTFYVQVGTEDSLGSSIPPGSLALVEPINEAERALPNPRNIYLLQFANGYRCCHCVVTRGKLRIFSTGKTYFGREEFPYPGSVRLAGRLRMFALSLPQPEYPASSLLPASTRGAELILPWEHGTRDQLFLTKHRRFKRSKETEASTEAFLRDRLHSTLSGRSERRYRRPTPSDPHANALIHLAVAHMARYTDALRAGGSWNTDRNRLSLETLLRARSLEETWIHHRKTHQPTAPKVWEARLKEFGGWSPLISMRFPDLRRFENRILRLGQGSPIFGLDPILGPGSLLLLDERPSVPNPASDRMKSGWSRPIYVLRRGFEIMCGYLDRDGTRYAMFSGVDGNVKASFPVEDLHNLRQVTGVAVPV